MSASIARSAFVELWHVGRDMDGLGGAEMLAQGAGMAPSRPRNTRTGCVQAVLFVRKLTLPVCSVISSLISGASFLTPAKSFEALVVLGLHLAFAIHSGACILVKVLGGTTALICMRVSHFPSHSPIAAVGTQLPTMMERRPSIRIGGSGAASYRLAQPISVHV